MTHLTSAPQSSTRKKTQYAKDPDDNHFLYNKGKKYIQRVNGTLLYIGRSVDSTLLTPLSAISSQKAKPTTETIKRAKQILYYVSTQDNAIITYTANDILLSSHSDTGYLNKTNARSRAGGHFLLSNNSEHPDNKGAILTIAHIIKKVMTSTA